MSTVPNNPSNVLAGPARIFVGPYNFVVNPVTGTPPVAFQHTDGKPSGLQTGFTEIGFTTGPSEWSYKADKGEIVPEQTLTAVDTWAKAEMAELTFTAYERVYIAMKVAMDNIGVNIDSTGELYYAGGGSSILTTNFFSVFMSHKHRDNTGKFSWVNIYKAYSVEGIKLPFEKGKETSFKVTLKAVADVSRSGGDQLFQMKHEQ